jgi:hypothetical protein
LAFVATKIEHCGSIISIRPSPVVAMIQGSWDLLFIKLVSVPALIWAVSVIAHRWGPSVGGLILGLPLTSGPVIFFLAVEQGSSFASGAALGTLLALISLSASCLVFSWLSFRSSWYSSLLGCCITYFAVTLLLNSVLVPIAIAFIAVAMFLIIVWKLFPSGTYENASRQPPRWEIPARMIAATLLVVLITEGAAVLGPHLSGLLTPFPVYATIMGVFIRKSDGAGACALFLRGVTTGCFTNSVFLFLIASFIVSLGLLHVFGLALIALLTMHSFLLYSTRKRLRATLTIS